jgi:hypothetical protein
MYRVEMLWSATGRWHTVVTENRSYCLGWMACRRDGPTPRSAMRVVRASDGKIVDECSEATEVGIGMIVGMVTAEQLEDAAARALERAAKIREMDAATAARRERSRNPNNSTST